MTAPSPEKMHQPLPLVVQSLRASYPGKEVLYDLDLKLRPGEVYGLLGRNAAGKTTLLNTLMRVLEPLAGSIRYWGEEVTSASPAVWRRISYLGEMAETLPHWTVRRITDFQEHTYRRLRREWVERFLGRYSIDPRQTMRALSRGQQQMVGLILAVAVEPDILLLDEPAAGLDPVARRDLLGGVLELLNRRRTAVLITSHIISDLERIVDRVGFLITGKIGLEGALDDLKERCALVSIEEGSTLPNGVKILRRRQDGRALVTGDPDRLDKGQKIHLGLEDLYVELLGEEGGGIER